MLFRTQLQTPTSNLRSTTLLPHIGSRRHDQMNVIRHDRLTKQINPEVLRLMNPLLLQTTNLRFAEKPNTENPAKPPHLMQTLPLEPVVTWVTLAAEINTLQAVIPQADVHRFNKVLCPHDPA